MEKPDVLIYLFRWRRQEQLSKSISKNIGYGITYSIVML